MFHKKKVKKSSKSNNKLQKANSYADIGFNNDKQFDITGGDPSNDYRVVQLKREIKSLKEKVEAQAELTRKLQEDKNKIQAQLDSYMKKCSDLQSNLDDKDQHLNEVVATLSSSYQHSKPIPTTMNKKKKSWFGWGSPSSSSTLTRGGSSSNLFSTPQHTPRQQSSMSPNDDPVYASAVIGGGGGGGTTNSPLNNNDSDMISDDVVSLPNYHTTLPCMTAPIGSLPNTRPRRSGSVHIINDSEGSWNGYTGDGTNTLIGMERNEMEFRIKNSSSNKLRSYVRDLFSQYQILDHKKGQLFQDLAKATHGQGWAEKQAIEQKKHAKSARAKEINAQNHIRSLEKSITKERKKQEKYKSLFEDFKQNAIKKRKDLMIEIKKQKNVIDLKDEFIQRACYKLIIYKDRLSQFEIPVFQEYVILIYPTKQILMQYDGEQINGPGAADHGGSNLNTLHECMANNVTPGGPGQFDENMQDINSNGGTVTSIASIDSVASADGFKKTSLSTSNKSSHRKSSSRKGSAASHSANGQERDHDGDGGEEKSVIDEEQTIDGGDMNDGEDRDRKKDKKRKKRKKKKNKRSKSSNNVDDDNKDPDQINIIITPKQKKKRKHSMSSRNRLGKHLKTSSNKKQPSLSNLSKAVEKKKISKEEKKRLKEEEKAKKRKEKNKKALQEQTEINEDYLDIDLDEIMSSSSSSSETDEDDPYILLTDSEENKVNNDQSAILYDHDGNSLSTNLLSNSLINYVDLRLVKYPGTGELFMVITGQNDKKDQIELFRTDFAHCCNIEKNKKDTDFTIYFENISIVFRCDDYEKTRKILINLRQFFETHSNNIQPELPPPPETTVTNQMNIFFGGF